MTIQPQNNNLNYLIDKTFTKVNRLVVLSFVRMLNYVPNIEKKGFSVLNDRKSFFGLPVKYQE